MSRPEPAEVLRRVIDSRLLDLHTALPGEVKKYDAAEQTVDVQPMIKQVIADPDGEELEESFPLLYSVPVVFPRGGGYFLSFPIQVGDFVLVVFAERSIDRFMDMGSEVHPVDLETHGLSGAVAYPGLYPTSRALAEADSAKGVFGKDGGAQVRIDETGGVQVGATSGVYEKVAHALKVNQRISNLETALNTLIGLYNAHIHITTATVGPGAVPGIISPTVSQGTTHTPGSDVSCAKVEVE